MVRSIFLSAAKFLKFFFKRVLLYRIWWRLWICKQFNKTLCDLDNLLSPSIFCVRFCQGCQQDNTAPLRQSLPVQLKVMYMSNLKLSLIVATAADISEPCRAVKTIKFWKISSILILNLGLLQLIVFTCRVKKNSPN